MRKRRKRRGSVWSGQLPGRELPVPRRVRLVAALITRGERSAIVFAERDGRAALIDWASEERLGFSAFVSMGNRSDVDEGGPDRFLRRDPHTKVIALYIEGEGRREILSAVRACPKPVVIFKAGRTERDGRRESTPGRWPDGTRSMTPCSAERRAPRRDAGGAVDFAKALAYVPPPTVRGCSSLRAPADPPSSPPTWRKRRGARHPALPRPRGKLREILHPTASSATPRSHRGHRRGPLSEGSRSGRRGVRRGDGDLRRPDPGRFEVIRPGRCQLCVPGRCGGRAGGTSAAARKKSPSSRRRRAVKALSCHVRFRRDRFPLSPEETDTGGAVGQAVTPSDSMSFSPGPGSR